MRQSNVLKGTLIAVAVVTSFNVYGQTHAENQIETSKSAASSDSDKVTLFAFRSARKYSEKEAEQGVGLLLNIAAFDPKDPPNYTSDEKCGLLKKWFAQTPQKPNVKCWVVQSKNKSDVIIAFARGRMLETFTVDKRKTIIPHIAKENEIVWLDKN